MKRIINNKNLYKGNTTNLYVDDNQIMYISSIYNAFIRQVYHTKKFYTDIEYNIGNSYSLKWLQDNFKNSHLPAGIDIICIDNIKLDNADASVRFTEWGSIDYMIDIKSIKGVSFQNNWEMINNIKTYRSKLRDIREYVKNCFPVIAFKITSNKYDSISKENGSVTIPIKELNI
tara:strand:- start:10672 stop:11193 length:522 start_codon:yes stop_codon:yes gene_type:complete